MIGGILNESVKPDALQPTGEAVPLDETVGPDADAEPFEYPEYDWNRED